MLELGERGSSVLRRELGNFAVCARSAELVDRDSRRDREGPRTEMLAVPQLRIRTKRAQERFLKRIVRAVAAQLTNEEGIDLLSVILVEALERRQCHVDMF